MNPYSFTGFCDLSSLAHQAPKYILPKDVPWLEPNKINFHKIGRKKMCGMAQLADKQSRHGHKISPSNRTFCMKNGCILLCIATNAK